MEWSDLAGTWKYAYEPDPTGTGWMAYLEDGRVYMPVYDELAVQKYWPHWLRVVIEAPNTFRVFRKADKAGSIVRFSFEGGALRLFNRDGTWHDCTRTRDEEAPQWFRDDVAKASASPPP